MGCPDLPRRAGHFVQQAQIELGQHQQRIVGANPRGYGRSIFCTT